MINNDPSLFPQSPFTKGHQTLNIPSTSRSLPYVYHFALAPNYFLYNHDWTGSKPISLLLAAPTSICPLCWPRSLNTILFSSAKNAIIVEPMFINPKLFLYYFLHNMHPIYIPYPWLSATHTLHSHSCRNVKKPRLFHHSIPLPVLLLLPQISCQFVQLSNYKRFKIFSTNCLKPYEVTLPLLSYLFQSLGVSWSLSPLWHTVFDVDFHYNTITVCNNNKIIM